MTMAANLPPVSTTPAAPAVNFATGTTGVTDTLSKFATSINDRQKVVTGINDTGGKICHLMSLMGIISDYLHLTVNLLEKNLSIC